MSNHAKFVNGKVKNGSIFVRISLTGGPHGLATITELPLDSVMSGRVTIDFRGRHLHFAATDRTVTADGFDLPEFSLSYITAIAE